MTITSHHNRKLREIRKLRQRRRWRERSGRFVAEGEDLLAAADAAGWPSVERYCVAGSGLPGTEVGAELLASASGLGSGTRTLAVYEERWAKRPVGPVCVYLHGLGDPGNVGTILRSAEAFGVSSVVLGPGSADPFSLKAVRASMGAVFAVPLVKGGDLGFGGGDLGTADLGALPGVKIALVPGEGVPLAEASSIRSTPRNKMTNLLLWRLPALVEDAADQGIAEPDACPHLHCVAETAAEEVAEHAAARTAHAAQHPTAAGLLILGLLVLLLGWGCLRHLLGLVLDEAVDCLEQVVDLHLLVLDVEGHLL
jgi:TrmH family RNA methyltransferase